MGKKNYLRIPPHIRQKITSIKSDTIVVGCAKRFDTADLQSGCLEHLDVKLVDDKLTIPKSALPPAESGKHSKWNIEGRTIKHTDLEKEPFSTDFDSPNFGDWSKGSHTVSWTRWRYPTEFISPPYTAINIEAPPTEKPQKAYAIKFELDEVFDKNQVDFEEKLLCGINLLQENIGSCDVQAAGATLSDYLEKLHVEWEILPPGTREEIVERVIKGRKVNDSEKEDLGDRYDFLMSLSPKELIFGSSGFARYFGAKISDDLVVFENISYGNAIYIMFENWKELSQRSRTELLSGHFGNNFERIKHTKNWKSRTRFIVKKRAQAQLL